MSKQAVQFLAAQYRKNPKEALVILGHSLGAGSAVAAARQLENRGIRVNLVFTIDPIRKQSVPSNVGRAYNYFQTQEQLGGGQLVAESSATDIANAEIQGVGHTELDNYLSELQSILEQILRLAEQEKAEQTLDELQSASCFYTGVCIPSAK